MRRLIASSTMLALASSGALVATPAGSATAAGATATARTVPTPFALRTNGFGTRVRGGQVPAGSGSTAWQNIGCTVKAGVVRENHEAAEDIPGLGTASEVTTRVRTSTTKSGAVVSRSRSTIASLTLADSPLGSLEINGIKSVSKTWHDAKGFHAANTSDIGSITLTPAGGQPQAKDLPTPDQPLDIPGLATIYLGSPKKSTGSHSARAANDALRIVLASGTRARVAHSFAQINDGIVHGIFSGYAAGSRVDAADGTVTSGRTPLAKMPCQGTYGHVTHRKLAGTDLGGQVVVGVEKTAQMAKQDDSHAVGWEQGSVAGVDIGGGQLTVDGIVGRVNVLRKGGSFNTVVADIKGTTVGTITANGQQYSFPATANKLEIPGVAVLRRNIKSKVRGGLAVTALRITLLDGNDQVKSVIDLGMAKMSIKKSGL